MSFLDYVKRLQGEVPRLSLPHAKSLVNDARRQIYQAHSWSFLHARDFILIPDVQSDGTLNVTRGLSTITPDATAKAWMDTFESTSGVPLTECCLQVDGGLPLPILNYDSSGGGTLTLEGPYPDASNPTAPLLVYRNLITPPSTLAVTDLRGDAFLDFDRFLLVRNSSLSQDIFSPKRPLTTQAAINRRDPQRSATGNPLWMAPCDSKPSSTNTPEKPRFELWPVPTGECSLETVFLKKGRDFTSDSDSLPSAIPEQLLMSLARSLAYEWADSHKGEHRELLPVNWLAKQRALMSPGSYLSPNQQSFPRMLASAIQRDRAQMNTGWLQNYYTQLYHTSQVPGGNYALSHEVGGGYGWL